MEGCHWPLTDDETAYVGVNDTYVRVVVVVAIDTMFGRLSGSSNHSKSNLAERTNMSEIRGGTEPRRRTDVPVDNIRSSIIFDTASRARLSALPRERMGTEYHTEASVRGRPEDRGV